MDCPSRLFFLTSFADVGGGRDLLSLSVLILRLDFPIYFPEALKSQHSPSPLSLEQRPFHSSPLMDALWFQDSAAACPWLLTVGIRASALLCPGFLRETVDTGGRGR